MLRSFIGGIVGPLYIKEVPPLVALFALTTDHALPLF
jgi:hypothetical protein